MARVRVATPSDVDEMVAMGRALHDESPRYRHLPFSESRLRRLSGKMSGSLLAPDCVFLVAEVDGVIAGMMIGLLVERWFCDERFATDLTMYVKPEFRGSRAFVRLLEAFERWVDEQGVQDIALGVSTEIHPAETVRIYERRGYSLAGHTVVKHGN